jgi:hypothetical protein
MGRTERTAQRRQGGTRIAATRHLSLLIAPTCDARLLRSFSLLV